MNEEDQVVSSEIMNLPADFDLNKAIEQSQQVCMLFEQMGIKEATLHNGNYYHHDTKTNLKTVVTEGCIVEERENTVVVTLKKIDSSSTSTINELTDKTQKALGAFVGKSQPWVSQNS